MRERALALATAEDRSVSSLVRLALKERLDRQHVEDEDEHGTLNGNGASEPAR